MERRKLIKSITGLALLMAVEVVLSIVSNYMPGVVNFNLALTPIVIGSVLFGPWGGLLLGACNGFITLIAPGTAVFVGHNAFMTIALCILKTGLAGVVSAFIYKGLRKFNKYFSIVLSGISVPIVNTGLFVVGVILFFLPLYGEGKDGVAVLFSTVITINFLIEFLLSVILSPAIIYIIRVTGRILALEKEENTRKVIEEKSNEENKKTPKRKLTKNIEININVEL